jgi:hypothetical protein
VDFPRKGRKGAEFPNRFLPLFFPYEGYKKLKFSQNLTWFRIRENAILLQGGGGEFFLSSQKNCWPALPDFTKDPLPPDTGSGAVLPT